MRKRAKFGWLLLQALGELARYDAVLRLRGFGRMQQQLSRQVVRSKSSGSELERGICEAVLLATCFYWKPVLCLQRSVCAARLLKKYGIAARLVIGYRAAPFFSHAWVEVDGRVVNGSSGYRQRLQTLYTA